MGLSWKSAGYAALGLVLVTVLLLVAIVAFPGLVGGDDAYIVTSGSMSPTIDSGDVIVTQAVSPEEIETGDVITVTDGTGGDSGYVTHRVVDIVVEDGDRYFELQGDANDQPDEGLVPAEYVQGTLHHHIPYLGQLLVFARSGLGLFLLVIMPGLALVASGGWQLLREFGVLQGDDRPAPDAVDGEQSELDSIEDDASSNPLEQEAIDTVSGEDGSESGGDDR